MRTRNVKIILGTVAVSGVLGVGVAAAATNQAPSTNGHGPQVTNTAPMTRSSDGVRLRARDGTGPRHSEAQGSTRQGLRARDGTGPLHDQQAGGRADCPYRG